VVHSTAEYASNIISQTGLNKPSNELLSAVALDLLAAFQAAVPNIPSPSFLKAHRWGGAFPTTAIASEEKCILEEERRIAVCGDFCVGPRVEDAVLSGVSAAEKVASLF
jgi:renalase